MADLIDRHEAIDIVRNTIVKKFTPAYALIDKAEVMTELMMMPSAQPKIIRCKDCKHWDGVDTCDVIDAPVWDNDFCSMAERRTDEE